MSEDYENWERPVRIKKKKESVQLTEYEKTGSVEKKHVLPEPVDYMIS